MAYIQAAVLILTDAMEKKKDGKHMEALELYLESIQALLSGVKTDSHAQREAAVRTKVDAYLREAEEIDAILEAAEQSKLVALQQKLEQERPKAPSTSTFPSNTGQMLLPDPLHPTVPQTDVSKLLPEPLQPTLDQQDSLPPLPQPLRPTIPPTEIPGMLPEPLQPTIAQKDSLPPLPHPMQPTAAQPQPASLPAPHDVQQPSDPIHLQPQSENTLGLMEPTAPPMQPTSPAIQPIDSHLKPAAPPMQSTTSMHDISTTQNTTQNQSDYDQSNPQQFNQSTVLMPGIAPIQGPCSNGSDLQAARTPPQPPPVSGQQPPVSGQQLSSQTINMHSPQTQLLPSQYGSTTPQRPLVPGQSPPVSGQQFTPQGIKMQTPHSPPQHGSTPSQPPLVPEQPPPVSGQQFTQQGINMHSPPTQLPPQQYGSTIPKGPDPVPIAGAGSSARSLYPSVDDLLDWTGTDRHVPSGHGAGSAAPVPPTAPPASVMQQQPHSVMSNTHPQRESSGQHDFPAPPHYSATLLPTDAPLDPMALFTPQEPHDATK